jgi:anti-sigma factor RsiW
MTCKDAVDIIADFLDQTLASTAVDELEAHLRDCEPCRAYLNTYRKTRGLVGEAGRVEMPEELKARLRRFLLGQLGSHPS